MLLDCYFYRWKMPYGIIGLWHTQMFENEWFHIASLGCDVRNCLTRNNVMWHHCDVIYVIMDYICVYALLLCFMFFDFSNEKSNFWVKLWFCMYMGVFTYYIIKKVEGGWLSNAYPCLKRSQKIAWKWLQEGVAKIGQNVIT